MSTIAAIATPQAVGGVSMIRISGDKAIQIAAEVFKPSSDIKVIDMHKYTACYGNIYNKETLVDDGVLLIFRAPNSYTGEDVAEITCHGGLQVTKEVLRACLDAGAVTAEAGEFTKRALLNGKMSLTQAEAVIDVIEAQTSSYLACSNAQKEGALYKKIESVSSEILEVSSLISAWIDFPDEDMGDFETASITGQLLESQLHLQLLLDSYDVGKIMREGISAVIVGKPNVGKSTLMNLLTGTNRSIVTDIAGTTRDIVEETVRMGDLVLNLADCAGLRETSDVVENIGVEIMLQKLHEAQIAIAVFDNSAPLSKEDLDLINHLKSKTTICIINKIDLSNQLNIDFLKEKFSHIIQISAKDTSSLKAISEYVSSILSLNRFDMQSGFIANERQRQCAFSAMQSLGQAIDGLSGGITLDAVGVMLEAALDSLLELSGKKASDEVISEVFKRFCVGK